ncbi:hypothetical protein [Sediminicoccus sp. BL-A-41-H5]|uniref:hypothetical protein n=1 Tax=Sediminicoccus sp. BL-A-41-H5 TaxID=3421106 RepID=UPI003D675736
MKRLLPALLLVALLPACATITTGTSQSIAVMTEPPGASCTLSRDGGVIAVVNPTPGTVTVSKSTRDIAVNCSRPGHLPGVASHTAQFQGMTVGNVLLGGLIGFGIDAASGALSYYPASLTLALPPETFATEQSRESFFTQRQAETRRIFDERIRAVDTGCGPGERAACNERMQALSRERDEELARLNALRLVTRVGA